MKNWCAIFKDKCSAILMLNHGRKRQMVSPPASNPLLADTVVYLPLVRHDTPLQKKYKIFEQLLHNRKYRHLIQTQRLHLNTVIDTSLDRKQRL